MKIKLKKMYGAANSGDEVDASLTTDKSLAAFYDNNNAIWFAPSGDFEIMPADYATFTHQETVEHSLPTILDVIGGDVKKLQLDVEFK